ncbi:MAG: phytoene desaturase [Bacteroidetes bacterium]|nr:phytoene desaturase [Bacteroidota bacterium]MBU1373555.1 phytoene desaturase [Bacteroidota bacterium]MBU1484386.1 phytoene desaturase [Bacteroidota bacterium]MBU1759437.1 phytoene desaturase [Bacteroidota bacterium]MBU2268612.1 phytoene desaturase [Bacteroidota bacterium]
MPKAIIIGAGIAGIASAIRLAIKGYQVDVFESNSYSGGKLSEFQIESYRFDAGPSLFTMPQYVDELFALAGKNPLDYFEYQKLEEVCRYFWEDKTTLTAFADVEKFAKQIEDNTNSTTTEIKKYLEKSKDIYDITHEVFLEKSLHLLSTFLRKNTAKSFFRFYEIDAFRTMAKANESFFSDKKMVQYANRFATYNGSDPYQAPATLNVIPHLEQHFGAFFPKGGMFQITKSLVKLAEDLGVKFHYNQRVDEICVEQKKVIGIKIKNEFIAAGKVISNMDVYFTYQQLLKDESQPQKILKQERSSSALIFYWGLKKEFSQLGLHNIFFTEDYQQEFDHIFKSKTIYQDPTVYINISAKLQKADAPAGCENWFTMINVPNNVGQDWEVFKQQARENIIKKLNRNLGIDLENLIEAEEVLDPVLIESKTSSYRGSLYGTSSNNQFAAFLRHANFSKKIKDLYFVGGSVHPGGGIPLALLSAKIVGEMIE